MRKRFVLLMVALGAMAQAPREFTNSVGMKFVRIDPGSFKMGSEADRASPRSDTEQGDSTCRRPK